MFRFGYGTQTLTLQIQVLFGYLLYLLPPRFTAGKSADQRNLSPRNEKRQFQSLVAVAGNRKREIEIQSEGWESCGGEGGTCCVWDQSFKVDHKEN